MAPLPDQPDLFIQFAKAPQRWRNQHPPLPIHVLAVRIADKQAFDATAHEVARRFEANFTQFADQVDEKVVRAGIRTAA